MTNPAETTQAAVALPPQDPGLATRLNFYSLSRPIQDRFLASAAGNGVPAVTLFAPARRTQALGWLALAILSPLALLFALSLGFGDLKHSFALQPVPLVAVYVLLGGATAAGIIGYFLARSSVARYPYRLGTYLFPIGIVVARDENLELLPLTDLSSLTSRGKQAVLKYPTASFHFELPAELSFEELEQFVETSRKRILEAHTAQNRRALAVLDPLRDSGFSNPLSSGVALQPPKDRTTLRIGAAALVGAMIGGLSFFARNKLGERVLFKSAREAGTTEAYHDYLSRGGTRPEVRQLLLPRAELAQARGSLSAVEQYAADNPDSAIRVEIEAALREELLEELEKVRKAGTLQAIEDFKKAHPTHRFVERELGEARAAVFREAEKEYRKSAKAGERVQSFFIDLIRHSQQHGPEVEVRFRRYLPPSVERADNSIRRSAYYVGRSGLPSQYFEEKHARPREQDAAQRIIRQLQSRFSPEILKFSEGEPLEGNDALPEVEKPTLFIHYKSEMSGGYTTQRPRGVYVGIGFMVKPTFVIPDHQRPLGIKEQSYWLPPDVTQIWRDQLTPEQVYDRSARDGFDKFVEKLVAVLVPASAEEDASAEAE